MWGHGVTAAGHAMVARDAPAGARLAGVPAIEHGTWLRAIKTLESLPEIDRELRRLRRRVMELEARLEEAGD